MIEEDCTQEKVMYQMEEENLLFLQVEKSRN